MGVEAWTAPAYDVGRKSCSSSHPCWVPAHILCGLRFHVGKRGVGGDILGLFCCSLWRLGISAGDFPRGQKLVPLLLISRQTLCVCVYVYFPSTVVDTHMSGEPCLMVNTRGSLCIAQERVKTEDDMLGN